MNKDSQFKVKVRVRVSIRNIISKLFSSLVVAMRKRRGKCYTPLRGIDAVVQIDEEVSLSQVCSRAAVHTAAVATGSLFGIVVVSEVGASR